MKANLFAPVLLVGAMLACGGGNGSGTTTPSGTISWQAVNTPFSELNFIDFGSSGHWFVADRNQGFYRSADGGSSWAQINSGVATTFGWTINVNPSTGDLIAGIYSSGGVNLHPVNFYRSSDEGSSWAAIQAVTLVTLDSSPAWTGCAFATNGNPVCGGYWAPSPTTGAWFSTNGGQSFTAVTTTSTNGNTAFALALNPSTNDLWMGTEQYGIFRSTDNGATWNVASPPDTTIDSVHGIDDGNIFAITFDRNGNVLFGSQGGIWKSAKNGSSFTWSNVKINSNTADGIALARDSNGILYYGHKKDASDPPSVYCSTDDGSTWKPCDSGMPQSLQVRRFVLNPSDRKLYAVVHDDTTGGMLYRTVNPVQ
jgi:hypothetical protein